MEKDVISEADDTIVIDVPEQKEYVISIANNSYKIKPIFSIYVYEQLIEDINEENWKNKIAKIQADNLFRPKEIYDIIKSANLVGVGDYLPWLSDTTFRMNRGAITALTALADGKAVATAMKLFITDHAVLLGAVATRPEYRGRGLAGALVTTLAESEKDKRVELLCKHDSIVEFYKSIGFEVKNEWSIITDE